ncbi:ATP-binding cassette domain-containing protein [Actinotalea sp. Marseille-Q4924]|uniref:ATP-binding cassette domain-containing protein n=1 Tax=Actinotalea sp. Marseille-Q4924 TaxID=2866571 RepID=UPI001CE3BAF4|nr:ATP-binding cassette domain-containing protein [Actinotalea sp. Marseille-Q4924]
MATPLLELQSITKTFGEKVANDRISLRVMPGQVHALVGENGAGKTTLMTMISGTAQPDSGSIVVDGKVVRIQVPQQAAALGIGMVYQHFTLVPSLTVAANVFLGRELRTSRGTLDTARMESEVAALSKRFGLVVDPTARIATLSVGLRQRVEVLKALSHDTRLLILDEPTAVLTPGEADELFAVIRSLARKGCAVLFISHKLGEVLEIADEVTVIRDGRAVDTLPAAGLSEADIATMMVGREVLLRITHRPARPTDTVLDVDSLSMRDDRGAVALDDLSLTVRSGEIVGIAGVEGNGQTELAAVIAGMATATSGRVTLDGVDVTRHSVARRRGAGLAYIPEDRGLVGTGPGLNITENVIPTHLAPPVARFGWIDKGAARRFVADLITKFDVRGASTATRVSALSGGNAQKVIIAREFSSDPRLLLVNQPTRGVDVGAMEFVHNAIVDRRDKGAGVLLISADLNEVMSLSDRLLVMYRGRVVAEFTQETMSEAAVGLAMSGVEPDPDRVRSAAEKHEQVVAEVRTAETAVPPPHDEPGGARPVQQQGSPAVERERGTARTSGGEPAPRVVPRDPGAGTPRERVVSGLAAAARGMVPPVVAVLIALAIGMIIIVAIGRDPAEAYSALFFSSVRSPQGLGAMIAQFVPLSLLAAAVIISFRAGFFNIGGEGQLYLGAFFGAWAGFTFTSLPPVLVTVLAVVCGMLAGMLWGLIAGVLLALWRVDIIVTTLMLSSIGVLLTAYLVTGPFKDPTAGQAASEKVVEGSRLPMLSVPYGIGLDLVLALVGVAVLALILNRSVWGLRVRQLGEMNRFAEYTGVSPRAMSMQVMAMSGAFAGLAGVIIVLGPNGGRFLQTFSPGYGFLGITVALLARLNPWAALLAALFYANMMAGSSKMQIDAGVPYPLVNVLQGLIILLITATFVFDRRTRERVFAILRPRRARQATGSGAGTRAGTPVPAPSADADAPVGVPDHPDVTHHTGGAR